MSTISGTVVYMRLWCLSKIKISMDIEDSPQVDHYPPQIGFPSNVISVVYSSSLGHACPIIESAFGATNKTFNLIPYLYNISNTMYHVFIIIHISLLFFISTYTL